MDKIYSNTPDSFEEIQEYVITNPSDVINEFFKCNKHIFYDTCSILHHSNAKSNRFIVDFLRNQEANIIITRTVLMELLSHDSKIDPIQVDYFKDLVAKGIHILLIDEELVLDIIKEPLSMSAEEANRLLGFAIKEVSKFKTAVSDIVKSLDPDIRNRILSLNPGSQDLYKPFFHAARNNKMEGDSLAEQLILVLIIILTKMTFGQYILASDDLRLRSNVITVRQYIENHHNLKTPMQLTTSRLVYEMHRKKILTDKNQMVDILSASATGKISVFCMGEEDIQLMKRSFSKDELLNKIISEPTFSIAY